MGDTGSAAVSANEDPPVACAAAAETPEYTRPPTSPNLFSILPHHPSPILPPSSPHPPPILPPSSPIRLPERVVTEASREVVESHGKGVDGGGRGAVHGEAAYRRGEGDLPSPILPPSFPYPPPPSFPHSPSPESGHGGIKASGGGACKAWTGEGAEQESGDGGGKGSGGGAWQGVDGGGRGAVRGRLPIDGARALVQLYGLPCSPEGFLHTLLERLQGSYNACPCISPLAPSCLPLPSSPLPFPSSPSLCPFVLWPPFPSLFAFARLFLTSVISSTFRFPPCLRPFFYSPSPGSLPLPPLLFSPSPPLPPPSPPPSPSSPLPPPLPPLPPLLLASSFLCLLVALPSLPILPFSSHSFPSLFLHFQLLPSSIVFRFPFCFATSLTLLLPLSPHSPTLPLSPPCSSPSLPTLLPCSPLLSPQSPPRPPASPPPPPASPPLPPLPPLPLPCPPLLPLSPLSLPFSSPAPRWHQAKSLPGAHRLLSHLTAAHVPVALASSSPRGIIATKLALQPGG
ncbi:unnamed protein product [Closterium sp. Naga37s-1]|nr:unnamed protein product [Closterium sp. Naga37s-1]